MKENGAFNMCFKYFTKEIFLFEMIKDLPLMMGSINAIAWVRNSGNDFIPAGLWNTDHREQIGPIIGRAYVL